MNAITLDPLAAAKLKAHKINNDSGLHLRLHVVGGGCAGFQYKLYLDEEKDDDYVFFSEEEKILVQKEVGDLVSGSQISYKDSIEESGFQVENPNAVKACGCGSSFVTKETDGCY